MLDPRQFTDLVIVPTLQGLQMDSPAARNLMLGTPLAESGLRHLKQIGGPALGLFQMEPPTAEWLLFDYIWNREDMSARFPYEVGTDYWDQINPDNYERALLYDLRFQCALARVLYWTKPDPLPPATDRRALGEYWKLHYNTLEGAGTIEHWMQATGGYLPDG